ncbi:hypothetical protein GGI03_000611 [Coemansia sp. RSA 2337]|nr:hypothetical protein GGI14_004870 [Coemansia sp. S680]KAJ2469069.1 hypothetical protein GGI03_000611 [Coemansia sp. RSA 2337]
MITPRFTVRQDDANVYITIFAAHVRAQTLEFDVDEYQFKFHASPYYLRLTFPGKVVEDESSTASLDASTGQILVTLAKQTPGEAFENLDLLSSLLATKRQRDLGLTDSTTADRKTGPLIEDIAGGSAAAPCTSEEQLAILQDEEFDWELSQTLATDDDDASLLLTSVAYGFNNQYTGLLAHAHDTGNDINAVPDPERMTPDQRRVSRIATEDAKFDESYYIDNYINDEDILPLIHYKTRFFRILRRLQKAKATAAIPDLSATQTDGHSRVEQLADDLELLQPNDTTDSWAEFTEKENATMLDLPRKAHLVSDRQPIYLGLVDILFAYSLDHRINQGDSTVESLWTIGAVSSTLSNLEQCSALRPTIVACFRRALAYPLYRNWELCEKVLEDVYVLFKLGLRAILKAMLEIKLMFDHHDIYYVYSKLYLDDYCVWLQTSATDKAIKSLAHELHHFELEKEEIGWNLEAFEDLALQTSESEDDDEVEGSEVLAGLDGNLSAAIGQSELESVSDSLGEIVIPGCSNVATKDSSDVGDARKKKPLIEFLD